MTEENFVQSCKVLAERFNFPARAVKPSTKEQKATAEKAANQENLKKDDSAILLKKLTEKKDVFTLKINSIGKTTTRPGYYSR